MSTATQARGQKVSDEELADAGLAHVLHTLVDLAPVKTEAERIELHQLVTDGTGGLGQGAASDAVTDPESYAAAKAEGAYDVPEPPPAPLDPRDAQIAQLRAQLARQDEQNRELADLQAKLAAGGEHPDPSAGPTPEPSADVPSVTGTDDHSG